MSPRELETQASLIFLMLDKGTLNKHLRNIFKTSTIKVRNPQNVVVKWEKGQKGLFTIKENNRIIQQVSQDDLFKLVKTIKKTLSEEQLNALSQAELAKLREQSTSAQSNITPPTINDLPPPPPPLAPRVEQFDATPNINVVLPPPPPLAPRVESVNATPPPMPPRQEQAEQQVAQPINKNARQTANELQQEFQKLTQRQLSQVLGLNNKDLLTKKPRLIVVEVARNNEFKIFVKGDPQEFITRNKKEMMKALETIKDNPSWGLQYDTLPVEPVNVSPPDAPPIPQAKDHYTSVAARAAAQLASQAQRPSILEQRVGDKMANEFLGKLKNGLLQSIVADYNKRENKSYKLRTSDLDVTFNSNTQNFTIKGRSKILGEPRVFTLSMDEVNAKVSPTKVSIGEYVSAQSAVPAEQPTSSQYAQTPNYGQLQLDQDQPATSEQVYVVPNFSADADATQQYAGIEVEREQRQASHAEPASAPEALYAELDRSEFNKYQADADATATATATAAAAAAAVNSNDHHEDTRPYAHVPGFTEHQKAEHEKAAAHKAASATAKAEPTKPGHDSMANKEKP